MIAVKLLLLFCELLCVLGFDYIVNPGPTVIATRGEVWPKPQRQQKSYRCQILEEAIVRYEKILSYDYTNIENILKNVSHDNHQKQWMREGNFNGYITTLNVTLSGSCNDDEYPSFDMKEEYNLVISNGKSELLSDTTWGILKGLETFSQLVYLGSGGLSLRVNLTSIIDFPRFSHRGLLVDTSRHFIPLDKIFLTLDAMSYNKLNVFHWHIVDDQSFPYVSERFPELSQKGAYSPKKVYTPSEIKKVVEYAKVRGIRVLSEFDTPGHTRSWGASHLDLLTECFNVTTGRSLGYGPMDPTKEKLYDFVRDLFEEILRVFPDQYVHLGGDEVGFACWKSNAGITKFMKEHNIEGDYIALESYYIQKLIDIVNNLSGKSIVWEEVFVNGVDLPNKTIVHVWRQWWKTTIANVTSAGKPALLSACWYLDHLATGGDWKPFYTCEPTDFIGSEYQKGLILGGEACMWSEVVNEYNILSRVWPRASAAAERLWSSAAANSTWEAAKRLEEHTCRMNRRGIGAQPPNGASFCRH